MKKTILSIIMAAISNVGMTAASQNAVAPLTLDQCVEMALKNNNKAITAENNLKAATELRREAFTKYFPEISAIGMAFWANHDILQYNLLNLIELGIIKNGKMGGVQAMQPVFTGGQIVNGNKLASVGEEVARLRREQTDNELRVTTETLFWKLATLETTKQTLESALTTLDSLQNQVQAAVDAGIVMRNDLLKVDLKRNTFRSEMVDIENGIKLVKMLLGQYVGLGTEADIEIVADVPDSLPRMPYDLFVPASDAVHSTVSYRLLQQNVEAKKLEKRIEIGKNLPTVAVGAGWYYHDLLDQDHNFGAVQIGVAIPLSGWWGGAHAIKRKSLELMNAQNERDDFTQMLEIDVTDKWNNLTAAYRKMEIETEGIAESEENLRLSRMYYDAGMTTITELLEAQTSYNEARSKYIAAYGAFRTAQAQYMTATGR